jgi:hypothetical protein
VKRDFFTLSLVLAGAGFLGYMLLSLKHEQPNISKPAPAAQRITDPDAILPAVLTELDRKIHVKDGLILITEESGAQTYVSSQWLVQCGVGVSIELGAATTGSSGTAGKEVEVDLFDGEIDKSTCAVVAPRVAARLQEMLGR